MGDIKNFLVPSMRESLLSSGLDFLPGYFEVAIDQTISDEILIKIPILDSIVGVGKCLKNVHDVLFVKKLAAFLAPMKEIDPATRTDAIKRWEANEKFRGRVGESLLGMIERCDDSFKAIYLSKLFCELVLKRDKSQLFMRAEKVLSSLSVMDIQMFLEIPEERYCKITVEEHEPFVGSGLYQNPLIVPTTLDHIDFHNSLFEITDVGKWIYMVLNDIPVESMSEETSLGENSQNTQETYSG